MRIFWQYFTTDQLKSVFKGRRVGHSGSILREENKSIRKEKPLAIDQITSLRTLYLVCDLF